MKHESGVPESQKPQQLCTTNWRNPTTPTNRQNKLAKSAEFGRQFGGVWQEAIVLVCLLMAAPIGLSPLHILTRCGSKRVLVVSTEPLDDLSCLTTPGVGCPRDGLLPVHLTKCIQMHTPSPCWVCRP